MTAPTTSPSTSATRSASCASTEATDAAVSGVTAAALRARDHTDRTAEVSSGVAARITPTTLGDQLALRLAGKRRDRGPLELLRDLRPLGLGQQQGGDHRDHRAGHDVEG